ncbi:3-phosphoshikimate 1-carboxyvinyltransferase [Thalassotalea agarivorans]|uniref:3-phosphoshikimate 1-carboxyvinyltransferase n=1 Tax=Thalassotalea agarivorans TaxID=349064 RepID=A0A1I0HBI5_THASX|nr:3-phosphoshikimate 1-carboxyvinyltransferase [Thalassotalea agarivorans]SET81155.1 3-phosphoshikimate 1-carboxyvinyltransferase [Thalassotalea agarivorans]
MTTEVTKTFVASPSGPVNGDILVPGDKSCSHRSIMFGSLAEGTTHVSGFLPGEDCLATMNAFKAMGVNIEGPNENNEVTIEGKGLHGLTAPKAQLNVGNSGTSIRLLAGILAGQSFASEMIGDNSLNKRPMRRVIDPLRLMGANIEASEDGTPPVTSHGLGENLLKSIHYDLPMASAQVKSCVLLAGMYADGVTSVTEPGVTRDHTERMLKAFGYPVTVEGNKISIEGGHKLTACDFLVPGDISSATFFMVAGLIAKSGEITIRNVGMNPTRIGAINILKQMQGDLTVINERMAGGEPVADIVVRASNLQGIEVNASDVPLAIDEFPAIFVAAACAQGTFKLRDAEELRVKESDRIQSMADGLVELGIDCTVYDDGIDIIGGQLTSGVVNSHDDHRIAMSFAIASLRSSGDIKILDCDNVATSFPNFVQLANEVGLSVVVE